MARTTKGRFRPNCEGLEGRRLLSTYYVVNVSSGKVLDDPGSRADEQLGRTSDSVRDDRPADHAGDAGHSGEPLVRADLDRDRDVQSARAVGV